MFLHFGDRQTNKRTNKKGSRWSACTSDKSVSTAHCLTEWNHCKTTRRCSGGPYKTIFIARQHTDARYWYSKSICLSVCPSVCPNGTNFNELEWPVTSISRSRYYLTLNNSQTVQDRAWRRDAKSRCSQKLGPKKQFTYPKIQDGWDPLSWKSTWRNFFLLRVVRLG